MANEKISLMTPADLPLDGTELVPIVQDGDNKQCTAQDIADLGGGGGGGTWGSITGTLSAQTDLQSALDAKVSVSGSQLHATASGTNTYTATLSPTPSYVSGLTIRIKFTNANTGASTINLNSLGAKGIKKNVSSDLASGDIPAGAIVEMVYDGTNFQAIGIFTAVGATWGSITGTLSSQSDLNTALAGKEIAGAAATAQAAAQAYADSLVVGLWDDRGSFSAAGGAYPSSGGSGSAGAIKKGDIWTISVSGTLPTGQVVEVGDTVRALIDTPGNTQANWSIQQNNIGYVPVNKAGDTMSGALAMGSNALTGLPAGTANGHALRYEQLVFVPDVLTDGATVNWELNKKMFPTATWAAATTTTTLAFTTSGNVLSGAMGSLKITTGTASPITITFPAGFTHKMQNVTFTTYTLPAGTGKDYVLTFWVVGTTLEWVIGVSSSRAVQAACSDENSVLNTGTNKIKFRMPYAMTLTEVRASLNTAQSTNGPYGGIFTVDINKNGTTVLSTKLTIDNTEKTSVTAATPAVISVTSLADDDEIEVDIDQIGDGTATGLKITLIGV